MDNSFFEWDGEFCRGTVTATDFIFEMMQWLDTAYQDLKPLKVPCRISIFSVQKPEELVDRETRPQIIGNAAPLVI
jgi:hypothetical protein